MRALGPPTRLQKLEASGSIMRTDALGADGLDLQGRRRSLCFPREPFMRDTRVVFVNLLYFARARARGLRSGKSPVPRQCILTAAERSAYRSNPAGRAPSPSPKKRPSTNLIKQLLTTRSVNRDCKLGLLCSRTRNFTSMRRSGEISPFRWRDPPGARPCRGRLTKGEIKYAKVRLAS